MGGARRALLFSAVILLLASLYVNLFLNKGEARVTREPLSSIPNSFQGWVGRDELFPTEILKNLKVDEYLMRRYVKNHDSIRLYVGYYRNQKEGAMPHSPRHCYPGSGFAPLRHDIVAIPVTSPGIDVIRPNLYVFGKGSDREVVIYWYQSRGRVIANEYVEKLNLVRDAIFRNRSDGALVRFSISTSAEFEASATQRLIAFARDLYPNIPRVVPN